MSGDLVHCSGAGCPLRDGCLRFRAVAYGRFDAFGTPPWSAARDACDAFVALPAPSHDAIRTRAYFRWIAAGRPEGTSERDWHEATLELESESRRALRPLPPPPVEPPLGDD